MWTVARAIVSCAILVTASGASAQSFKKEHPGDVALVEEGGGFTYKQFPTQLRLYVFDGDKPGKLGCTADCLLRWPPVVARDDAKPTGDWTLVSRENGQKQWAYKNRPAYIRYHDSPTVPTGDGVDGAWHILKP